MFIRCENLKRVVFSNNTEEIEGNEFQNCANLKQVILPDSIKSIGNASYRTI